MNRHDSQNMFPRIEIKVRFQNGLHGRKRLRKEENKRQPVGKREDLPRLTRLLALAHRWNCLIEEGVIANYSEIARLMGLSRARVTQIMDLQYLAPNIQESILGLPNDNLHLSPSERGIRMITRISTWEEQDRVWSKIMNEVS